MVVDAEVTTNPADLANVHDAAGPVADNTYSIRVRIGTVSNSTYIADEYWAQVDSDLDRLAPENFGLRLSVSNITSNFTWQNMQVTFRGTIT